jgi:hypothetical protein
MKSFLEILQETTYKWDLDPVDRSWYVSPFGTIEGDVSHRFMLKKKFPEDWASLSKQKLKDGDIENILEKRLILGGTTKIGELDNFYTIVSKLDNRRKDVLQGFCSSLIKVRKDIGSKLMGIHDQNSLILECTISDIINDFLYQE